MKRLVIKVGTAVLTQDGQLALERMDNLVNLIYTLYKSSLQTKQIIN
jgi:glutamate 5-kinase